MDPLEDDDALFLADVLLDECKEAQRKQIAGASERGSAKFFWVEEDEEGNPLPKRSRAGDGRKRGSSTGWANRQPSTATVIQPSTATATAIHPSTVPAIQPSTISAIQPSTGTAIHPSTTSVVQPTTAIHPSTATAIDHSTTSVILPSTSSAIQPPLPSCPPAVKPSTCPGIHPSALCQIQPSTSPVHTVAKKNQGLPPKKKAKKKNQKEDSPGGEPNGVGGVGALFHVWEDMASTMVGKGEHQE